MYTYYSATQNRVRELTQEEAATLNAAGGDWAMVPAPPPYDPATHNQPQFSNGAWVEAPKTAEELDALADSAAMAAEREQLRQVYQDLRNGVGTTAQRFARVEKVCAHLIKHLFAVIALVVFLTLPASAQSASMSVKITWDAPSATEPAPTGYALYRKGGTAAAPTWTLVRRYTVATLIPARTIDVTLDGAGTYALTAYNAGGESDRSDEVVIPGKPGKPIGVRIQIEFTP
jgi:hypothetical protein